MPGPHDSSDRGFIMLPAVHHSVKGANRATSATWTTQAQPGHRATHALHNSLPAPSRPRRPGFDTLGSPGTHQRQGSVAWRMPTRATMRGPSVVAHRRPPPGSNAPGHQSAPSSARVMPMAWHNLAGPLASCSRHDAGACPAHEIESDTGAAPGGGPPRPSPCGHAHGMAQKCMP